VRRLTVVKTMARVGGFSRGSFLGYLGGESGVGLCFHYSRHVKSREIDVV
jgi:hypothetical protein